MFCPVIGVAVDSSAHVFWLHFRKWTYCYKCILLFCVTDPVWFINTGCTFLSSIDLMCFLFLCFSMKKKIVEWYNDVYSSLTATSHGAVPRNIFLRRNSSVYDRDVKWTFILHLPISGIRITDIDNSINRYRWFKMIFPYKYITLFPDIGNSIFRYWKITLIYRNRKIELPISVNNFDFPILVNQSIYR